MSDLRRIVKGIIANFHSMYYGGDSSEISDVTFDKDVHITTDLKDSGLIFKDCIFNKGLYFQNSDLKCGIKLINCTVKDKIVFTKCVSKKYDPDFNFFHSHIYIARSNIKALFFDKLDNGNNIERGVQICDDSEIEILDIKKLACTLGGFSIQNSKVKNSFNISQAVFKNGLEIRHNCTISTKVRFENIAADSYTFTESRFEEDIHIWGGNTGSFTFNDGVFDDDFNIKAVKITGKLTLIGVHFKKSLTLTVKDENNKINGGLKELYIQSTLFEEPFVLNGDGTEVEKVDVVFSNKMNGSIYLNACYLKNTIIKGDNHNSNLVLSKCFVRTWTFELFSNYSNFTFSTVKTYGENSTFKVKNSNLGKTQFYNILFDSFTEILIENSVFTDIITANVTWFSSDKLNSEMENSTEQFSQNKEIYRQLKYALEKQGSRVDSLQFKSLEMATLKQELFFGVKLWKRIFNVNRFVLLAGRTNSYGQNWGWPILWAIILSIILFFPIVVGASDKLSYQPEWTTERLNITCLELLYHLKALPQLMNPTHILSRIFPNSTDISFGAYFWDYLLKIGLAFFIYQTISAFRKYMKS